MLTTDGINFSAKSANEAGISFAFDANVKLQQNYAARQMDKMQGYKPPEVGPNAAGTQTPPLSSGKGNKSRKRALELML